MPELPDIENFKSYLKRTSLYKEITDIKTSTKSLIKKATFSQFKNKLKGKSFKDAKRRGKFLIIEVKGIPEKLIFHFGMTGSLKYEKQDSKENDFANITFRFKNGYQLKFLNPRKLGKVYLVEDLDEIGLLKKMGPEPLEISKKEFIGILDDNKRKSIKSFLMSQEEIAGIGNIFSDEIMFRAGIDPRKKVKELTDEEKNKLYEKIKKVLKRATEIGPPEGDFSNSWLINHRKKGGRCPKCGTGIKNETIAGRSAYYCPRCQK